MSLLLPLAIVAFLISPFAISGYLRAWRVTAVVWVLLAIYTAYVWTLPMPVHFDEQDRLGAAAWQMILVVLTVGSAVAFAVGFAVSALRSRRQIDHAKEAVE